MKRDILIYFDIITSIKTVEEADSLLGEIDTLMLTFFRPEETSMEKALKSISADLAFRITQVFIKNNLDINNRDTVALFFKTLKELVKKLNIIKLSLAFDPTSKTIESIHDFIKENLGIGYILDTEVSKDILAGAIIMFNGRYYDFSLKKAIEDAFANKKETILKFV